MYYNVESKGVSMRAPFLRNRKKINLQNTPTLPLLGGQHSWVALANVSFAHPQVLILNKPTNNLGLESLAALTESVRSFKGTVVCVAHNQIFVQTMENEAWVGNGRAINWVKSFEWHHNQKLWVLNKSSITTH